MSDTYKKLGAKIRQAKKASDKTDTELSRLMGVSKTMLYYWCSAKRKINISQLKKLSEILNVDLYDLLK